MNAQRKRRTHSEKKQLNVWRQIRNVATEEASGGKTADCRHNREGQLPAFLHWARRRWMPKSDIQRLEPGFQA